MTTPKKAAIIHELAQYHSEGTLAIDSAYDMYVDNWGAMSYDEFHERIDIREIDDFGFMYDAEKDVWASNEEMAEYYDRTFA